MTDQPITYLTDAVLITAVVPAGRADAVLEAARSVGATGGIVHHARGTGARERLGLLAIAVEAEREVVTIVAAAEYQQLIAEAIYHAAELDVPGGGFLYIAPIEKLATFIPKEARDRLAERDKVTR